MMKDGEVTISTGPERLGINLQDYKKPTRLYCMNGGHHLQLFPDGTVGGKREESDIHTVLRVKALAPGVVVIQGSAAGRYLAMNREGQLYGSPTLTEECSFLENIEENHYNTYRSQKNQEKGWYVGLKKNGKPKLGHRTHLGQKAVFFLPRRLDDPAE